ncbi:MAG: DUF2339 domain-containing protein [Verrucomicrobia bacterium]|nr:DUF2339 domain-containing protein [Verrucomicrobiota bacterium]
MADKRLIEQLKESNMMVLMEWLIGALILTVFITPIAILYYMFRCIRRIECRLEELRKNISNGSAFPAGQVKHGNGETEEEIELKRNVIRNRIEDRVIAQGGSDTLKRQAPNEAVVAKSTWINETVLGQKVLLGVGVLVLILGIGYFLQYSFQQGWIHPPMRVVMTYLSGSVLMVLGEFFRRKNLSVFGLAIIGTGIATLYFANFASHQLYGLIGAGPAMLLMVTVTILAVLLAVVYDSRWLALFGLIGGFLSPLVIATEKPAALELFSYLTILNASIVALAYCKKWVLLNHAGWLGTWLIFTVWYLNEFEASMFWYAFPFYLLFFLTYALIPSIYAVRRLSNSIGREWIITLPNALIALTIGTTMVAERYEIRDAGLLTVGLAGLFLSIAVWIKDRHPNQGHAFTLNIVKAIVFLGITIPILFEGPMITGFWILLGVALAWAALSLNNKWVIHCAVILGIMALMKFYLSDFNWLYSPELRAVSREKWQNDAFIRLTLLLALGGLTLFLAKKVPLTAPNYPIKRATFLTVAWLHLFYAVNMELRGFFYTLGTSAVATALTIFWTVTSMVLLICGFRTRMRLLRTLGILLFSLTAAKVLLFDMAQTDTPYRILSSIVLGILLIAGSFLYFRYKHLIESNAEK